MTEPNAAEVAAYAAAVRAELDDLDPAVRDELLEDLEGHLAEVASDVGGALADRLGPPSAYADELRTSAGLPARARRGSRPPSALRRAFGDAVRSRAERLVARVERTPGGPQVLAFLPELRPGWWVLRGWIAVVAASIVTSGIWLSTFPVPRLLGSAVLGLIATAAAVAFSVRVGRATPSLRPQARQAVVAANVVLVVAAIGMAQQVRDRVEYFAANGGYPMYVSGGPTEYLTAPTGPISNIYAFDAQGNPLTGVQLFDQHGNPLDILLRQTPDGQYAEPVLPMGIDGRPRGNVFPREYRVDDYDPVTGERSVRPVPHPTFRATPLAPSSSPSASPSPSGTAAPGSASPTPAASPSASPSPSPAPSATPRATPAP